MIIQDEAPIYPRKEFTTIKQALTILPDPADVPVIAQLQLDPSNSVIHIDLMIELSWDTRFTVIERSKHHIVVKFTLTDFIDLFNERYKPRYNIEFDDFRFHATLPSLNSKIEYNSFAQTIREIHKRALARILPSEMLSLVG